MKKKSPSALPIQFLETRDTVTKFASLSKPEAYPEFHYLHGFLCAIATTPSQVSLAEWSEVLHNNLRFSTAAQEEEVFHFLIPMVNGLLLQISEKRLEFPPDVDIGIWASGFDAAHREFKHLWDIILSEMMENSYQNKFGEIQDEKGIDFKYLLPLIQETTDKIQSLSPVQAQTGPAIRYDRNVIDKHLQMLAGHAEWQSLYEALSKGIHERTSIE